MGRSFFLVVQSNSTRSNDSQTWRAQKYSIKCCSVRNYEYTLQQIAEAQHNLLSGGFFCILSSSVLAMFTCFSFFGNQDFLQGWTADYEVWNVFGAHFHHWWSVKFHSKLCSQQSKPCFLYASLVSNFGHPENSTFGSQRKNWKHWNQYLKIPQRFKHT